MKKLLLSTLVLLAFSVAIILFQISCKKSAVAATPTTTTAGVQQQNKILFVKNIPLVSPGTSGLYQGQIYSANYDGTDQQLLNITLPKDIYISYTPVVTISPNQKTIFFSVSNLAGDNGIYSSNIDGTNPKQVVSIDPSGPWIQVAY